MLLIDTANVVGSRPDGWWRDRPGATSRLIEQVRAATVAGRLTGPVVMVLEGAGRRAAPQGVHDGVQLVHAPGEGDDTVVELAAGGAGAGAGAGTAGSGAAGAGAAGAGAAGSGAAGAAGGAGAEGGQGDPEGGAAPVTVVTADRALGERLHTVGAVVVGPRWLLGRLEDGTVSAG